MTRAQAGAMAEWRQYGTLPFAAMLGYSVSVLHIYGIYPYILPVTKALHWSRAEFTGAFTLAILIQAIGSVPLGMLVDRYGSRRFGLIGVVLLCGAFALLSRATGNLFHWYLLWGLITLVALPVQATVWTSAVASRFSASRGMALAITLCGASIAQFVFPPLATWLIGGYGWRTAFMAHGLIWLAIVLPIVLLWFRGARDNGAVRADGATSLNRPAPEASGITLARALRSSVYLRLFFASLTFTFTVIALNFQFIPILAGWGIAPERAAWLASLTGLASIAGRLVTGWLIDRFSASWVGGSVFLLPTVAVLLLLFGRDLAVSPAAVAVLLGLTLGAEVDVIVYLTTRFFGLASFGRLYGGLLAALSIGTATGPLAASAIFDATGGYDRFFWLAIALLLASSIALISLPATDKGTVS